MNADLKHAYRAGVDNVFLVNGFERIEAPYGTAFRYNDSVQLDERVCSAVIQKPGRLNASEILYLRLRADWRQEDLAHRLHVSAQTVSLWERGQARLQPAADLLLRIRFLAEAPKRMRPQLKVRNLLRHFDSLVTGLRDFNFIGYWDSGWTFRYEPRASSFVAAEETLVGGLLKDMDTALLGLGATPSHQIHTLVAAGRASEWVRQESLPVVPDTKYAGLFTVDKHANITIVGEKLALLEIKRNPRRVFARYGRRTTSGAKVEKFH